jgi:hypothetical protein
MYPTVPVDRDGDCDEVSEGVGARINDPQVFDRPPDLTKTS